MSGPDPYDLDEQQRRADLQRVSAQLAAENDDADIEWLMSGPRGRRIVRRLLDRTDVFKPTFHPNAMVMAQNEGKKDLGYWLVGEIERLCPEGYYAMLQETRR